MRVVLSHGDHIPLERLGFAKGLDTCKKRISEGSRKVEVHDLGLQRLKVLIPFIFYKLKSRIQKKEKGLSQGQANN